MRCLTLADALAERGSRIRFVCRHLPAHFRAMLQAKGYEVSILERTGETAGFSEDLRHARWLGTSQEQDASDVREVLSGETWDWLVVDHYALDSRWESALRPVANKILVVDDLADRQHDCDILLDQNLFNDMETRYAGKTPVHCRMLLGPRYALLRKEFGSLHENAKPRIGPVKRVFIFFGGVDARNYSGSTIEVLSGMDLPGVEVDIVLGAQHPESGLIKQACERYGFHFHLQTAEIAPLMDKADMAIGAGGVTMWERSALGLPSIVWPVAENQAGVIRAAAELGIVFELDTGRISSPPYLETGIRELMNNSGLRSDMSARSLAAVDGRGAHRVCGALFAGDMRLRKAVEGDCEKVFNWRNHPRIRKYSGDPKALSWDEHQSWFADTIRSGQSALLIAEIGNEGVGVIRFDINGVDATVSIYVAPGSIGMGYGRRILELGENWLRQEYADIVTCSARVLDANRASTSLFQAAGYKGNEGVYVKNLSVGEMSGQD